MRRNCPFIVQLPAEKSLPSGSKLWSLGTYPLIYGLRSVNLFLQGEKSHIQQGLTSKKEKCLNFFWKIIFQHLWQNMVTYFNSLQQLNCMRSSLSDVILDHINWEYKRK